MNYKEKVAMMNKEAEEAKSKAIAKLQQEEEERTRVEEERRRVEEERRIEETKVEKSAKKEKK